jgi:hypothetical protein
MLAEISLSKYDFHLLRSSVRIELEVKSGIHPPEQLPSNTKFKWKVFIEHCDSKISSEVNLHTARNSVAVMRILDEISLLPGGEFRKIFETLFTENDLAGKTLVLGLYQRMYRYMFKKERFDSLQRQYFEPVEASYLNLPKTNPVMEWRSNLSEKYNQERAIDYIKNRFRNSQKCNHITIEKLKKDKNFPTLINELRGKGWLDWQIVLSITNFMLNYKTRLQINQQTFETEEQGIEAYNKLFREIQSKDEKDCYVDFPLEAFQSAEFKFQLNHTIVIVLEACGFENKSRFPNFSATKELLDIRFNMKNDMSNEGNPLSDVI